MQYTTCSMQQTKDNMQHTSDNIQRCNVEQTCAAWRRRTFFHGAAVLGVLSLQPCSSTLRRTRAVRAGGRTTSSPRFAKYACEKSLALLRSVLCPLISRVRRHRHGLRRTTEQTTTLVRSSVALLHCCKARRGLPREHLCGDLLRVGHVDACDDVVVLLPVVQRRAARRIGVARRRHVPDHLHTQP